MHLGPVGFSLQSLHRCYDPDTGWSEWSTQNKIRMARRWRDSMEVMLWIRLCLLGHGGSNKKLKQVAFRFVVIASRAAPISEHHLFTGSA